MGDAPAGRTMDVVYTWVDDSFEGYRDVFDRYARTKHDREHEECRHELRMAEENVRHKARENQPCAQQHEAFEARIGRALPFLLEPRRAGDVARLVATGERTLTGLGWSASLGLGAMVDSSLRWHEHWRDHWR